MPSFQRAFLWDRSVPFLRYGRPVYPGCEWGRQVFVLMFVSDETGFSKSAGFAVRIRPDGEGRWDHDVEHIVFPDFVPLAVSRLFVLFSPESDHGSTFVFREHLSFPGHGWRFPCRVCRAVVAGGDGR